MFGVVKKITFLKRIVYFSKLFVYMLVVVEISIVVSCSLFLYKLEFKNKNKLVGFLNFFLLKSYENKIFYFEEWQLNVYKKERTPQVQYWNLKKSAK